MIEIGVCVQSVYGTEPGKRYFRQDSLTVHLHPTLSFSSTSLLGTIKIRVCTELKTVLCAATPGTVETSKSIVHRPLVGMDNCTRVNRILNYRKESRRITSWYNLHVTQGWSVRRVYQSEHPHISGCGSPSMVLCKVISL